MKRLFLVASLCVAAAVVAPIASASANEEVVGSCVLKGVAEFNETTKEALAKLPSEVGPKAYSFNGEGTCAGTVNGVPQAAPVTVGAHVEGSAKVLSCSVSVSVGAEGKGYLEVPKGSGKKATFSEFTLLGHGTNVTFVVSGEGSAATGTASFAADAEAAAECGTPLVPGPKKLEFTASANGKVGQHP